MGLLIVNQGEPHDFDCTDAVAIRTIDHSRPLSLSAARNLALRFADEQDIRADHIVFPDDDTTFDSGYFENWMQFVTLGNAYLGSIRNAEDKSDYMAYPAADRLRGRTELLPWVASTALAVPWHLYQQVGEFDEELGVGAKWGSSEDLDYFLRCCEHTEFHYVRQLSNYHPSRGGKYAAMSSDQIRRRFRSYSDGYLRVLYRHGLQKKARSLPIRAAGGAVVSLLSGAFRLVPVYLWLACYRLKILWRLNRGPTP